MEMTDPVPPSGHAQGKNSHIERISKLAQVHKLLLGNAETVPISGEMLFHHVHRKCIMARGYWSMRRENASRSDLIGRFFKRLSLLYEFSYAFEKHEGSVTFVCVKDGGLDS